MKNSLGRVFLILLTLLHVEIFASTYEWSASANKTTAYVNEAIHLTYTCKFSDRGELYTIDFNPIGDYEKYSIKLLREGEDLVDDKRVNNYEFIAFVKESGAIDFDFDIVMKTTTQESINYTTKSRDDDRDYEDFSNEYIKQKTLHVEIRNTLKTLVGDFSVEVKKDKSHIKAYEPYHMQIIIKGDGNFESIKPIEFKIDDVKIFASNIIKNIQLTKDGYSGSWSQKFAFVASGDFEVPELNIEYFSLKEKKLRNLVVSSTNVEVTKGFVKEELLDNVDSGFKINYDYFYYLLIFIAGYLFAKIKITNYKSNAPDIFLDKVQNANSMDELMIILALKDSKKFEHIILQIETKKLTSLKDAKKIIKLI